MDESIDWRDLYKQAMLEADSGKVSSRVRAAREAMISRNLELERDLCNSLDERWEIADGMAGLEFREALNQKRKAPPVSRDFDSQAYS